MDGWKKTVLHLCVFNGIERMKRRSLKVIKKHLNHFFRQEKNNSNKKVGGKQNLSKIKYRKYCSSRGKKLHRLLDVLI
jgi:hypothetical protein